MPQHLFAAAFLIAIAGTALLIVVGCLRPGRFTLTQRILWLIAVLITRLQWRSGRPEAPAVGDSGAVIVSNHRSSVDPFFVQVCLDRPIRWLVAREYCEHPAFSWFLTTCDVIPVNRGGIDTAATRAAIRTVKRGGVVGMFPEGRINMSDQFMLPVRPGAVMVALKAGVPLIPCYIEGSPYDQTPWSPFLMTARVRVRFGPPIWASNFVVGDHADDQSVKAIMFEIARQIALLAGESDYEPQLAGRRWKPTDDDLAAAMESSRRRNDQFQ